MKENKSSHIKVWLVVAVIAIISYIAFVGSFKDGITLTNDSAKNINDVSSIEDAQNSVGFKLDIPSYIADEDDLHIEDMAGQLITINNNTKVLKASTFVAKEADILGLYEKAKTDNKYNVSNSDIIFFRYRQHYSDYPNCTIINWCTEQTTYGLMTEENISLDEALSIVGISKSDISEYTSNNDKGNSTESNIDEYKTYTVNDNISISLPEFSGEVTHADTGGTSAFFAGDTLLFLVVYNEDDIKNETYNDKSVIDVSDEIKVYYDSHNTYDPNTEAYNDYELMLSTIKNICSTIVCKK